jgi:crotonobetainyl-CoA:carnitine CoA-transferase CaiB-like acyl-CoA transferase
MTTTDADTTNDGALAGIRVLELANFMAGPFCGMLLADMGAEVIKVENPAVGDYTRTTPPFVNGESAGFMTLNRNKKSVTLNLKAPAGKALFLELAATADVILENFRPGTMTDLGIDYEAVRAVRPDVIYCSASGFGQTGPYSQRPGFDLILQGMSGIMSITGEPEGAPVKVGVPIADLACALFGSYAILTAYVARQKTGQGQYIDLSLFESAVALGVWETSGYYATGEVPGRLGSAHRVSAPYQAFRTKDGYITLGATTPNQWPKLCQAIGKPELEHDPRFATNADRKANDALLAEIIESALVTESSQHWLALFEPHFPCGLLNTYEQVLADPHLQARGFLLEMEHPKAGPVRTTGFVPKLSGTPARIYRPAPVLGQHNQEILGSIGHDAASIKRLKTTGII